MTQRTHISKRSSRRLSRCNLPGPQSTRSAIVEPYNCPQPGMSPREYQRFHQVRCELEKVSGRKVSSQETRGAIALLTMIAAAQRVAKIVERRRDIEETMRLLHEIRFITKLAAQQ